MNHFRNSPGISRSFASRIARAVVPWVGALGVLWCVPLGYAAPRVASPQPDHLRALGRKLTDGSWMVLIGFEDEASRNPQSEQAADRFRKLGFAVPPGSPRTFPASLEPKFLVTIGPSGVRKIHAFEIGPKLKTKSPGLPGELLDVERMRRQILAVSLDQTLLGQAVSKVKNGARATFAATAMHLYDIFGGKRERDRERQGTQFESIVRAALDDHAYPELRAAMSGEELVQAGGAAALRYSDAGKIGALVRTSEISELYNWYRARRRDMSSGQFDALNSRANQEGLVVESMGTNQALLLLDCRKLPAQEGFSNRWLDVKGGPEPIRKQMAKVLSQAGKPMDADQVCAGASPLIPLGVYSLDRQNVFLQLIDFGSTNKLRNRELVEKMRKLATSISAIFVAPAALALGQGDEWLDFLINRSHSSRLVNRGKAQASLIAAGETAVLKMNREGMLTDVFVARIAQMDRVPAPEKARIAKGLSADSSPTEFHDSINRLVSLAGYQSQGVRYFSGGLRREAGLSENRQRQLSRLEAWLGEPARQAKYAAEVGRDLSGTPEENLHLRISARLKAEGKLTREAKKFPQLLDPMLAEECRAPGALESPSAILIGVDGLNPESLRKWAAQGLAPNMKKYVLDRGVEIESYANNTISAAQWPTIWSGNDADRTAIRGSTFASRDPRTVGNELIDPRFETHFRTNFLPKPETRLLQRMNEAGSPPVWSLVPENRRLLATNPIHYNIPWVGFKEGGITALKQMGYDVLNEENFFDRASAVLLVDRIRYNPCQYRMVGAWFGSIDGGNHTGATPNHDHRHSSLERDVKLLDQLVGDVMEAAERDPVLRHATLMLVSDHGLTGGIVDRADHPIARGRPTFVDNTEANLNRFFSGDYLGASKSYDFDVGSHKPHQPLGEGGMYVTAWRNFVNNGVYTNRGKFNRNPKEKGYPHGRNLRVEPYGDAMSMVFVMQGAKADPARRLNFHQLSHYAKNGTALDIPRDLLGWKLENTDLDKDPVARRNLEEATGLRPVQLFSMGLQDAAALAAIERLAPAAKPATREPVLVRASGDRAAMILVHDVSPTRREFRYVVLKGFSQDADGTVYGTVSHDPKDDPLGIHRDGMPTLDERAWLTDEEWLPILRERSPNLPTSISAIATAHTLTPDVMARAPDKYRGEHPDFVVWAAPGFTFNSHQHHQGDHGGLSREEARNAFFISGPCLGGVQGRYAPPVFSRNIAPTLLGAMGIDGSRLGMQGRNLLPEILSQLGFPAVGNGACSAISAQAGAKSTGNVRATGAALAIGVRAN